MSLGSMDRANTALGSASEATFDVPGGIKVASEFPGLYDIRPSCSRKFCGSDIGFLSQDSAVIPCRDIFSSFAII